MELLQKVTFLQDLDPQDLHKLADAMVPKHFKKGEYLARKGEEGDVFYIIKEGKVKATDISVGSCKYDDMVVQSGGYLGERGLLLKEPRAGNYMAMADVHTLTIDKDTFLKVLGDYTSLVLKSGDTTKLVSRNLSRWLKERWWMVAGSDVDCLSQ